MELNPELSGMKDIDKIGEALQRSLPYLPSHARMIVSSLLKPQTLSLIAGTLFVWAGSHAFGVGAIVDVILLGVGVMALGFAVFEGAGELYQFTITAVTARRDSDLDRSARHFANAVTILGVSTVQALLLRGQGRMVIARQKPMSVPRVNVGNPPQAGNHLQLSRPTRLPGGALGGTDAFGSIQVARNQPMTEQRITLLHELVHRYFSPKLGPFRRLRAEVRMSLYTRSALLRYLEETMAEGYAQLRVHGLAASVESLKFPLTNGYVTVSQLTAEGRAIGTIALAGNLFNVSLEQAAPQH